MSNRKYASSSARKEFERSVIEIEKTMRQIAPPVRTDPDLKNYILGAAVLFLSAKLENYISDLFCGICQEACRSIRCASGVPPSLLGWAFLNDGHLERSRRFVARNDEGDYIGTTGRYLAEEMIANGSTYLTPERFDGIDDKSYPSVKNVKKMYHRLGVPAVFKSVSRRLRRNVENELESFNSIRGSLAHSGLSGGFSYGDIKEQIQRIRRIVRGLDQETFYHLRNCGADSAWTL